MQIAQVVGTVVSTQKHPKLHGAKLLLVQPQGPDGTARGAALLAIDSVGAGIGERVLVVIEGKAAGDALGRKAAPVDAAIIGIIDSVDHVEQVERIDQLARVEPGERAEQPDRAAPVVRPASVGGTA